MCPIVDEGLMSHTIRIARSIVFDRKVDRIEIYETGVERLEVRAAIQSVTLHRT